MISVQILRGIAAMMVIVYHITQKLYVNGDIKWSFELGAAGVDIFFIISGFIIYYSSVHEFSANEFMKKRIFRIYPLYWVITLVTLVISYIRPGMINQHVEVPISMWNSFTLFPVPGTSPLLIVAWTLSFEMFFYVIYYMAIKLKVNRILFSSVAIAVLVVIGQIFKIPFINDPITLEFIYGMIIAYLVTSKNTKAIMVIAAACLILSATPVVWHSEIRSLYYGIPALALFCVFLLLEKKVRQEGGIIKLAQVIGDSSYSIYLTHLYSLGIVFILIKSRVSVPVLVVVSFIVSVIIGILCYKLLEKRIIKSLRPLARKAPLKDIAKT